MAQLLDVGRRRAAAGRLGGGFGQGSLARSASAFTLLEVAHGAGLGLVGRLGHARPGGPPRRGPRPGGRPPSRARRGAPGRRRPSSAPRPARRPSSWPPPAFWRSEDGLLAPLLQLGLLVGQGLLGGGRLGAGPRPPRRRGRRPRRAACPACMKKATAARMATSATRRAKPVIGVLRWTVRRVEVGATGGTAEDPLGIPPSAPLGSGRIRPLADAPRRHQDRLDLRGRPGRLRPGGGPGGGAPPGPRPGPEAPLGRVLPARADRRPAGGEGLGARRGRWRSRDLDPAARRAYLPVARAHFPALVKEQIEEGKRIAREAARAGGRGGRPGAGGGGGAARRPGDPLGRLRRRGPRPARPPGARAARRRRRSRRGSRSSASSRRGSRSR